MTQPRTDRARETVTDAARRAVARPDPDAHPAAGDGERVRPDGVSQPANTASSLAYVLAGGWLAWRARRSGQAGGERAGALWFAALLAANGPGGVGFHGHGDPASKWLHDGALTATMASLAVHEGAVAVPALGRHEMALTGGAAALAALGAAAAPASANVVTGLLAAAATAGHTVSRRRGRVMGPAWRAYGVPAALFVAGGVANGLAHTGSPMARPDARVQGHAVWHMCTAAALAAWGDAAYLHRRDR